MKRPSTTFGSKNSVNKLTASQISQSSDTTTGTNLPKLIEPKEPETNLQTTIDQLAYQPVSTTNIKSISRPTAGSVDVKAMVLFNLDLNIVLILIFLLSFS